MVMGVMVARGRASALDEVAGKLLETGCACAVMLGTSTGLPKEYQESAPLLVVKPCRNILVGTTIDDIYGNNANLRTHWRKLPMVYA